MEDADEDENENDEPVVVNENCRSGEEIVTQSQSLATLLEEDVDNGNRSTQAESEEESEEMDPKESMQIMEMALMKRLLEIEVLSFEEFHRLCGKNEAIRKTLLKGLQQQGILSKYNRRLKGYSVDMSGSKCSSLQMNLHSSKKRRTATA
eukprot:Gregarina_sp_Poly_1__4309@NODE_233_length_11059_cov_49_751365_g206_i0_p8_GENE_NODE_233_length_11059_cov_49_751365_g206_i0NODE_233_length_11059_cov_49_751365_g206_i0_p8_ORF_typecomplete_len150_score34_96SDA1/PF05285_12/0_11Arg_decarbox_C/PF17944_1/1_7e02Arg_decarbox_C/PF17944_1/4_4BSP_II/PF05432_11/3_NODE_233_length_11059_cov_49_751365_g206_i064916940